MNIVFFGTSSVGLPILDVLRNKYNVLAVVTSPDALVGRKQELRQSPIAEYAEEHNLLLLKPERIKKNIDFIADLRLLKADIFIVVSYGKIMPPELLNIPRFKTLNVHFSMLPKYRGASPIQQALLNGDKATGTTIFILDEQVDHGSILSQHDITIEPDDTFSTLAPKLSELSASLLLHTLPMYIQKHVEPVEQKHEQATNTTLIKKEQGRIDWHKSAHEIYNQYRAFEAWPGIWTTWNGKIFKILQCSLNTTQEDSLLIPCGNESALTVTILQLEGRNAMTAKDFMNGYPNFNSAELE